MKTKEEFIDTLENLEDLQADVGMQLQELLYQLNYVLSKMTEFDQYALLQQLNLKVWFLFRSSYDSDYKIN